MTISREGRRRTAASGRCGSTDARREAVPSRDRPRVRSEHQAGVATELERSDMRKPRCSRLLEESRAASAAMRQRTQAEPAAIAAPVSSPPPGAAGVRPIEHAAQPICSHKEGATSSQLFDAAGRRRSPATLPGHHAGQAPRNKGRLYPADPPTVDEIVAVMREAPRDRYGLRLRALIVILWRGGLRIQEALSLTESDLDQRRGGVLIRFGKGGRAEKSASTRGRGTNTSHHGWPNASSCRSVHCSA